MSVIFYKKESVNFKWVVRWVYSGFPKKNNVNTEKSYIQNEVERDLKHMSSFMKSPDGWMDFSTFLPTFYRTMKLRPFEVVLIKHRTQLFPNIPFSSVMDSNFLYDFFFYLVLFSCNLQSLSKTIEKKTLKPT